MEEQRRFIQLMSEIAADVRDGTRDRLPELCDADAVLLARGLQREVDKQEAARALHAVARKAHVACRLGCVACCESVVMVYRPEALLVADWLSHAEHQEARDRFQQCYRGWRDALGEDLDQFQALHASGDRSAAESFYEGMRRHRALCAFNYEGACVIYPVRPNVCRYTMALDTSDYCGYEENPTRGPAFLGFPPMDEVVKRSLALLQEAEARMENTAGAAALCAAVRSLL